MRYALGHGGVGCAAVGGGGAGDEAKSGKKGDGGTRAARTCGEGHPAPPAIWRCARSSQTNLESATNGETRAKRDPGRSSRALRYEAAMRAPHPVASLFYLSLLVSLLAGCGPTLRQSATGWQVNGAAYWITPADGGRILPDGWTLSNYERSGDGFRKAQDDIRDLAAKRDEDDGILVVARESIASEGAGKKLQVLAERWLQRNVVAPNDANWRDQALFEDVVPPLKSTATLQSGFHVATAEEVHGRNVETTRQEDFTVPKGSGFEIEANLVPNGAQAPDRRLYLGVLRATTGQEIVIVAYANTPSMFAGGLGDAASLAHRVHF